MSDYTRIGYYNCVIIKIIRAYLITPNLDVYQSFHDISLHAVEIVF